jgi:D-alanyl-D-alanine carboxypeptidase/D-alanyl-D-alanine-endopeptidase (penicillin-binding protein 4)
VRRPAAVLGLTLCLHACASRAPAIPPAAPAPIVAERIDPIAQLRTDLHALFTADSISHAHWGVHVVSLGDGDTLFGLDQAKFFIPASNEKIVTTAVAAERLGWDYRFTTRILATSPISPSGTVDGDLIVVGDGDPSINPRHPARWQAFDDWAAALHARGLRLVTGSLIADDDRFGEPGWAPGWSWDDLQFGYGAEATALQFNENQIEVIVGPGMGPGTPAIIATSPADSGVFIVNLVTTIEADGESRLEIDRRPGTTFLEVRGRVAAGGSPVTVMAAVDHATRFYVKALVSALGRRGILVAGNADIDEVREPLERDQAIELLVDRSPPLSEIADVTNKWSRNGYAETLLLAMAPPEKPATIAAGLVALRETLTRWGVQDEIAARDGSGLSRYDSVTPRALTTVLRHVAANPALAETFRSTLPVAGISGSLADRLKGTPAEGRVAAKTGSMSGVRTLSGYLTTIDGEGLAFSILSNNYRVPSSDIDAVMDRALLRLVQFQR